MIRHDNEARWYDDFEEEAKHAAQNFAPYFFLIRPPAIILPFSDGRERGAIPFVTYNLLMLNAAIFALQVLVVPNIKDFFDLYGLVSAQVLSGQHLFSLFTHQILHASILHLGFNLLFLWIFGDDVERALGHLLFMFLYIASGLAGAAVFLLIHQGDARPCVGASGAIAGVLGAYFMLFPTRHVRVFFLIRPIGVPAIVLLGLWFWWQIMWTMLELASNKLVTTGFSVHVTGFVFGAILALAINVLRPSTTGPPV